MRNTIVFCSWISEIVLEWLHQGCGSDLSADFLNCGAIVTFPLEVFLKVLQNRFFVALASRSGFGAAIPAVSMYKKASLCNFFFCKSVLCVKDCVCVKACCV